MRGQRTSAAPKTATLLPLRIGEDEMAPGSKPSVKTTGKPTSDRAHDILHSERHPLDAIFSPKSVAVIGATERPGSIGRNVLWNLLSNPFGGTVFPINPNRSSVLGIKTYPSISAV